jgi:hypothetical protein
MKRSEIEDREKAAMKLLVHLRDIGDFSANAPHVRETAEHVWKILQHLLDEMPKPKAKRRDREVE